MNRSILTDNAIIKYLVSTEQSKAVRYSVYQHQKWWNAENSHILESEFRESGIFAYNMTNMNCQNSCWLCKSKLIDWYKGLIRLRAKNSHYVLMKLFCKVSLNMNGLI